MSDPLRDKIIEGLSKLTDREKFEACAAELIGRNYPGLVALPGGSDGGFDGVGVTKSGRVIQLVGALLAREASVYVVAPFVDRCGNDSASEVIGGSWSGPESRHHDEKLGVFQSLLEEKDPRIVSIGKQAIAHLTKLRDQAKEREHIAAVKGRLA
jgi:hypothetical protein